MMNRAENEAAINSNEMDWRKLCNGVHALCSRDLLHDLFDVLIFLLRPNNYCDTGVSRNVQLEVIKE